MLFVQVMCALLNISSASEKSKDDIINCDEILKEMVSVLVI